MYQWRRLSETERESIFASRVQRGGTWRRAPIWDAGIARYMITAACYEHQPIIGLNPDRMASFESGILELLEKHTGATHAHVILPNHYHALVTCRDIAALRKQLGQFHGRTSFLWNKEEQTQGRQAFHGSAETVMKSERHYQASLNYIHHNPVKHGYVQKWKDWPYSSAQTYLTTVGKEEAEKHWLEYPIERYGAGWDQM